LLEEVRSRNANVVLLDLDMPGRDPMEALADLGRSAPGVKVMILSALLKDNLIDQAVQRGAQGYFLKSDSPAEILAGIRQIAAGATAFSPAVEERLSATRRSSNGPTTPLQSLTPRELEVLRLIGQGLSRAEIARAT
jgi:DNA-binding NarL/FixJ family response regulator